MQRVGFIISKDMMASILEKDAENQILLCVQLQYISQNITVGCSQKACLSGIAKMCSILLFFLCQNILDTMKVC